MNEFILSLRHQKQHSDWDCGVTCVQMLMDSYQVHSPEGDALLQSYHIERSTWTIDLLHLLQKFGIPSTLRTITIGCAPNFDSVPYYQTLIDQDRPRVERLFKDYANEVKLGSTEWKDLKEHLIKYRRPCIVLVDANILLCKTCYQSMFERLINRVQPLFSSNYQGHYVLLVGFENKDGQEFVRYVDPGKNDQLCSTTQENFDQARKAFGTDEDIIFCYQLKE